MIVLFDVDGTLTETNDVDSECYREAVSSILGAPISSDWGSYEHVTDSGILDELFRVHRGRSPHEREIALVKQKLMTLLRIAQQRSPERFRAVSGASAALEEVSSAGWTIGIATGAWECSATLKLEAAGIPRGLPLVSADAARSRVEIFQRALQMAREHSGEIGAVLVGDAPWDLATARSLRIGFVGVGGASASLRRLGATQILDDFSDREQVMDVLRAAGDQVT